jgi:two-component system, chemotaxis family, CheB/CheR fusion protein
MNDLPDLPGARPPDASPAGGGPSEAESSAASPPRFPVVGIGASAGGLEAFREFFGRLPGDTGMAFIVVQHLSPELPSILTETLTRLTALPVVSVQDRIRLAPDRVYVLPSNAEVLVEDGALRLVPRPASPGGRLPIDRLFSSLAAELRTRAIGVVLSGTGGDGTHGLKDIKAEGGITFAQAPTSAQFGGMPQSAAAAGVVDRVLPADEIAAELGRLSRHPYVVAPTTTAEIAPAGPSRDESVRILALVRKHSGVDFSQYKQSTLARRIARRMALQRIQSTTHYVDLLEREPAEAKALSEDLLIHVTGFFRDAETFAALKRTVFPALLAPKREGPLRCWIPGCSSGEEVYSLAMALLEHLGETSREIEFQLFGSDLSATAIERARAGLYPESALQELSEEQRQRFFTRAGEERRITRAGEERRIAKSIRDRCVFVVHDLTRDPPFAKLDLISCRNVLIYFGEELHERVLSAFHYCLNRPGFLMLGRSENVTSARDLFEPADLEHRIFARVGERGRFTFPRAFSQRIGPTAMEAPHQGLSRAAAEAQRQADHLLLARFAPPGVVVNERLEVIQFRGRTGEFLENPPGRVQLNLLNMVRAAPLLSALRGAITLAKERGSSVRTEAVQVSAGDRRHEVAVEVTPLLTGREPGDRYFLVTFHEGARAQGRRHPVSPGEPVASGEAERLAEELAATKEYLESVVEQHQYADDEVATVNEELVSANEELQSTNEELESAKEELQSANEELTTLNEELRGRNAELDTVANDLSNILDAANIPIVIVDRERRIRRFTPEARQVFTLIPSDVDRLLDDIKRKVEVPDLDDRLREVMRGGPPCEREVQDESGRWFRMQIRPYHAGERGLDGAVLSFFDVDVLKSALREAESGRDYARAIVEAVRVPLLVVDERHQVLSSNPAFERVLGGVSPVRPGDDVFALHRDAFGVADVRRITEEALAGGRPTRVEIHVDVPELGVRIFAVLARMARPGGRPVALLAFEDLTEQRRFEEERTARAAAEASNRAKDVFLATLSHELRTPLSTILMQAQVLRRGDRVDAKVEHASAAIHRAASHQKRLIDDLLDVSRIISGKLTLDQHVVDLGAVVDAAVEETRAPAEAKGIGLHTAIEPGVTAVYADPTRMQQVVSNLLTNATKFTPRGGTIAVALERSGEEARITVRDTGIGIPREFLPLLFTRFSQADSSATRTYNGLGLGLAIVKHFVDLHGGQVGADSDGEGHGATFWVRLPLVRDHAPPPSRRPRSDSVKGLRVLIVEDDDSTRECLEQVMSGAAASVRAVGSAAEGIEALKDFKPDVLLSDLAMPRQDGFSFIAQIRRLPPEQGGAIPAAAVSALAGVEDVQRALAAGFHLHVPKPVDVDGLLTAVAQLAAMRAPPKSA